MSMFFIVNIVHGVEYYTYTLGTSLPQHIVCNVLLLIS